MLSTFLAILFTSTLSQAADMSRQELCDALLTAPSIARVHRPAYPIEIESAGAILSPHGKLPRLESGFYLYLVTRDGELIYSNRYQLHTSPQALVTHKALVRAFEERRGGPPDVVAAGEFQVAFGDAVEIRNKSGNFPAGDESLNLAVEVLRARGLPVLDGTKINPVIPGKEEDLGHTPRDRDQDAFRLQVLRATALSARGRTIRDMLSRFYVLLRQTFPAAKREELIEKFMDAQAVGAGETGQYDGYQTIYYPLQSAFTTDGLEYGIYAVEAQPDRGGVDGFHIGGGKQIRNFVIGAYDRLTPEMRDRWESLALGFDGLSDLKN